MSARRARRSWRAGRSLLRGPLRGHVVAREEERTVGDREAHADARHHRRLRLVLLECARTRGVGGDHLTSVLCDDDIRSDVHTLSIVEVAVGVTVADDRVAVVVDGVVALDSDRNRPDVAGTLDGRRRVDVLQDLRVVVEDINAEAELNDEVLELDLVLDIAGIVARLVRVELLGLRIGVAPIEVGVDVLAVRLLQAIVAEAVVGNAVAERRVRDLIVGGDALREPFNALLRTVLVCDEPCEAIPSDAEEAPGVLLVLTAELDLVDADLSRGVAREAVALVVRLLVVGVGHPAREG